MMSESEADLQRAQMVEVQLRRRGIRDLRVLVAMAKVPRHEFVAEGYRTEAYEDHPIPIAEGQTISQPYIVAKMLEALKLNPDDTALEIGTGSGYQTALVAELCKQVYSIERHVVLAEKAKTTLASLNYTNAMISVGDGTLGLSGRAPFDVIVVSAAASRVPTALIDQLREGGRMIIPIGPPRYQELTLVTKREGVPQSARLEACRFVPLIWAENNDSNPN